MIKQVLPKALLDENTKYYINPTGKFVIGGPSADCGLTGRKIIAGYIWRCRTSRWGSLQWKRSI